MTNFKFGNTEIYHNKGIELGFSFDDPLDYPHRHTERSPFKYSDGLGQIESHDGGDLKIYNRDSVSGMEVPDERVNPGGGLWVKLPGSGFWGSLYMESHAGGSVVVEILKSKNRSDPVADQSSITISGSSTYLQCNIMSDEALWLFVSGGHGELMLHRATFVPIQAL